MQASNTNTSTIVTPQTQFNQYQDNNTYYDGNKNNNRDFKGYGRNNNMNNNEKTNDQQLPTFIPSNNNITNTKIETNSSKVPVSLDITNFKVDESVKRDDGPPVFTGTISNVNVKEEKKITEKVEYVKEKEKEVVKPKEVSTILDSEGPPVFIYTKNDANNEKDNFIKLEIDVSVFNLYYLYYSTLIDVY